MSPSEVWTLATQIFTGGLSAIGVWFLYETLREYRSFKSETGKVLSDLKAERGRFELAIDATQLKIKEMNSGLDTAMKNTNFEIEKINFNTQEIKGSALKAHLFYQKSLELGAALNTRTKKHEEELQHMRQQIGKALTIFKTKK